MKARDCKTRSGCDNREVYRACRVLVKCMALGLVNLEKRVSQDVSLALGSFKTGSARARKCGTRTRLCFSAREEHTPKVARS